MNAPPRLAWRSWWALLRPGDYLVVALALGLCGGAFHHFWRSEVPDRVEIRSAGKVWATLPLHTAQRVVVPGPLGLTEIEIEPGRVRVAADPGPRQYCVAQGWLNRSGALALCAPNQVSVALQGGASMYDSLNY